MEWSKLMTDETRENLRPDEVANLDPYKRRTGKSSGKAKELLSQVEESSEEIEFSEIQRFSAEQKEALKKKGYVIYELTGQSIASLRRQGKTFWSSWHENFPDFEALTSRKSEVAINPINLLIPGSNNKTLAEQLKVVKEFGDGLNIRGVEAILGQVPDYAELTFAYLDKTGQILFGERFDDHYYEARTQTQIDGVVFAGICLGTLNTPRLCNWDETARLDLLYAAPLIVPASRD